MDIYVVQNGDTLASISELYHVPISTIIHDNGLENSTVLVPGQTLVIVHPSQTYIVQKGDTLDGIAAKNGISLMQLLRNNSFLCNREYIYPGESLVIRYPTCRELTTNGFVYPYINEKTLRRTLPYLTFLSVLNYRISDEGRVITYDDDSHIIQMAKAYDTIPLLMISALSPTGEANAHVVFEILINKNYQNYLIESVLEIMKRAGYRGVNVVLSSITPSNFHLYIEFLTYVSNRLAAVGYYLFLTVNPSIRYKDNTITFHRFDYGALSRICYQLTFLQYVWGTNSDPPAPVSSTSLLKNFLDYVVTVTTTDNLSLGIPIVAYDWALPYIPSRTIANVMTLNSVLALANDAKAAIQFDDFSQTPYFYYYRMQNQQHIVWSINAKTIESINEIIKQYNLAGSGIWNIMVFYQQMWTIINACFDII